MLYKILDLFHRGGAPESLARKLYALGDALDLDGRHAGVFLYNIVCLGDGGDNFNDIELDFRTVPLDNLHCSLSLS